MPVLPEGAIPFADFREGEFVTIPGFPHPTQMCVMPVVAVRGNVLRPLGTCFAISNHGLVMTARHVIDEALRITDWGDGDAPLETDGWWVGALYAAEPQPGDEVPDLVGGILPANRLHMNAHLDVGVMHLNLPIRVRANSPIRVPAMRLSPGLPNTGTLCFAIGYHAMRCDVSVDRQHTHEVRQSYSGTRGRISQIHFPRRDSAVLNFPCFETTSRFDHGMSGGPILGENGSVIGVVCSSFGELGEGHVSYGSLIGPALFLQIDTPSSKAFLYDFVTGGSVACDDTLSRLNIQRYEHKLEINFGRPPLFDAYLPS